MRAQIEKNINTDLVLNYLHHLDDVPSKSVDHTTGVNIAGQAQKFTNIVYRAQTVIR